MSIDNGAITCSHYRMAMGSTNKPANGIDKQLGLLGELKRRPLVGDGAMGTALYYRGFDFERCYEELNLTNPDVIIEILQSYIRAGAEVIETNSFCANAVKLKKFGLDGKVREINLAAAQLARRAAEDRTFVLGSIGPLRASGEDVNVAATIPVEHFAALAVEQAQGLIDGGVDGLILETFIDLAELEAVLKALRQLTKLPLIAQMSFSAADKTPDGKPLAEMAKRLEAAGADVIGANCISGPALHLAVAAQLCKLTRLPVSSFPNAGYPQQVDGRYVYSTAPQYFGKTGREAVQLGVRLVGGCCGTTDDHIRALAQAIQSPTAAPVLVTTAVPTAASPTPPTPAGSAELMDRLKRGMDGGKPFVTVEVEPPRSAAHAKLLEKIAPLAAAKIDAFNISNNPLATVHMDSLVFAMLLKRRFTGSRTIVHLTCRDHNLLGLQATLLGAHALEIDSLLALTGDPASIGDQPGAKSVYNVNSIGLVELIRRRLPSDFPVAVALNPNSPNLDSEFRKLDKKLAAGAQFIQTQPLFRIDELEPFLERLKPYRLPVLLGVLPLLSHASAEFIHNEIPGIQIPASVIDRLHKVEGEAAVAEGKALCCELIKAAKGAVAGFYLITPQRRYDLSLDLVNYINQL